MDNLSRVVELQEQLKGLIISEKFDYRIPEDSANEYLRIINKTIELLTK